MTEAQVLKITYEGTHHFTGKFWKDKLQGIVDATIVQVINRSTFRDPNYTQTIETMILFENMIDETIFSNPLHMMLEKNDGSSVAATARLVSADCLDVADDLDSLIVWDVKSHITPVVLGQPFTCVVNHLTHIDQIWNLSKIAKKGEDTYVGNIYFKNIRNDKKTDDFFAKIIVEGNNTLVVNNAAIWRVAMAIPESKYCGEYYGTIDRRVPVEPYNKNDCWVVKIGAEPSLVHQMGGSTWTRI